MKIEHDYELLTVTGLKRVCNLTRRKCCFLFYFLISRNFFVLESLDILFNSGFKDEFGSNSLLKLKSGSWTCFQFVCVCITVDWFIFYSIYSCSCNGGI